MSIQIGPQELAQLIFILILCFIAYVFWVSYYRIRSYKLLLTAVAFTLLLHRPLSNLFGYSGPHVPLLDIIIFSFIAISFYKKKEWEEEPNDINEAYPQQKPQDKGKYKCMGKDTEWQ